MAAVAAAAPVANFDAAAATALLAAHPPVKATGGVDAYLGTVDGATLDNLGFDWGAAHTALVATALASYVAARDQAAAAAAAAAGTTAAARAARLLLYDKDDPTTWVLNPIEFHNSVTKGEITATVDGTRVLDEIANGHIRPHGASKNPVDSTVGREFHAHLVGGSWGLAFIYVQRADGSVTPHVYDIAMGRGGLGGNRYDWRKGATDYNSNAAHPT